MKRWTMAVIAAFGVLSTGVSAHADDGEVTMRILTDPKAGPDEVVREIRLPQPADERARESSGSGREEASQRSGKARERAEEGKRRGMSDDDRPASGEINPGKQNGGDRR